MEGIRVQEGSLHMMSYALGIPSWATFGVVTFPGGAETPFFGATPTFGLNVGQF